MKTITLVRRPFRHDSWRTTSPARYAAMGWVDAKRITLCDEWVQNFVGHVPNKVQIKVDTKPFALSRVGEAQNDQGQHHLMFSYIGKSYVKTIDADLFKLFAGDERTNTPIFFNIYAR